MAEVRGVDVRPVLRPDRRHRTEHILAHDPSYAPLNRRLRPSAPHGLQVAQGRDPPDGTVRNTACDIGPLTEFGLKPPRLQADANRTESLSRRAGYTAHGA